MSEGEFTSVSWDRGPENSEVSTSISEEVIVEAEPSHSKEPEIIHTATTITAETPQNPNTTKGEELYIKSTVSDPQKEQDGSQNPFISYLITTESNNPVFQSTTIKIRRRFSDFYFLYHVLLTDFSACAIPPLPDKKRLEYIKGDRFGKEFTLKRASSLNRFLNRISYHPVLKRAKAYHVFLESNDWNAYKRQIHIKAANLDNGNGLLVDGISDSFMNVFRKAQSQNKEFVEVRERVDKLEYNLNHIDKIFSRVVRRQGELKVDYKDFAEQILKLASLEPNIGAEFNQFANGLESLSRDFGELKDHIDNDYLVSLRDMENYVVSLKELLRQKDQKQIDFEALTEYLQKASADYNYLKAGGGTNFLQKKVEDMRGVNHEVARQDRIQKLEMKVESLTREVGSAKLTVDAFEGQTYHEIQYFDNIKALEMKDTLGNLTDSHIDFFKSVIASWEPIEESLKQASDAHNKSKNSETNDNTENIQYNK